MCAHRRGASFGCLYESDRQLRGDEIRTAYVSSGSRRADHLGRKESIANRSRPAKVEGPVTKVQRSIEAAVFERLVIAAAAVQATDRE